MRLKNGVARLSDYFDLIAGTSTGSIIASLLATGQTVGEIRELYLAFCRKALTLNPLGRFSAGLLASKFRIRPLQKLAEEVFAKVTLGDPSIVTGLLIMLHRADSNSPWPVHNHPCGKYYGGSTDVEHFPNKDFPIANLVLASCAAPSFFRPQRIEIRRSTHGKSLRGLFVDGSLSPHKNPAMQALRVATIPGYGFHWPLGDEQLSVVSVGTGVRRRRLKHSAYRPSGMLAIETLFSLLDTCNDEVELMMQWMSNSSTARSIDAEVGDLSDCCVTGQPAFRYWRFNLPLERDWLEQNLGYHANDATLNRLHRLDGVGNMAELDSLAQRYAALCVPPEFE